MSKPPFERIVAGHGGTVLRVCRALLRPADAQDAWSETFLAALRAYPQLPEDANVQAWLVRIAHRKAVDLLRGHARRAIPVGELPEGPSTLGIPTEPDGELWTAVRRLPDRQRHAVVYHHVAGLPHRDVAEIVGGTPEAVRRAAADGIKGLRRALADGPTRPARASPAGRPRADHDDQNDQNDRDHSGRERRARRPDPGGPAAHAALGHAAPARPNQGVEPCHVAEPGPVGTPSRVGAPSQEIESTSDVESMSAIESHSDIESTKEHR